MGDKTKIEWADATWNPTVGCTKVSEGCDHCYAERLVEGRLRHRYPAGFGRVKVHPDRVNLPLRWHRPRRVFVNSLSDLFHEQIPYEWRAEIFAVMAAARRHTFQVLTKRPGVMASLLSRARFRDMVRDRAMGKVLRDPAWSWEWPLPNVWLGVSVESQKWADVRIPNLLETPAAVRFLSCEPLLGPVDLQPYLMHQCDCADAAAAGRVPAYGGHHRLSEYGPRVDWVIVGGESGPGARPMHPTWARSLRDQCQAAGVPFFFKQWGEHRWVPSARYDEDTRSYAWTDGSPIRVGKTLAGRVLDGCTWDEYPTTERSAP